MSKKLRESLKKTIVSFVMIATIVSLSGVIALAPSAQAAAWVTGDLVSNPSASGMSQYDVYVVKVVGTKMFKRLILNPTIFNSYGGLFKWSDIKTVNQATMDSFTTSALVRIETGAPVYALQPLGDIGSNSWLNVSAATFEAASGDWDSIYVINSIDGAGYTAAGDLTTQAHVVTFLTAGTLPGVTVVPTGAGLSVSLTGTDAASRVAAMGSNDVVFSTVKLAAGSSNVTVSSVAVTRGLIGDGGIAADANFTNVKLYKGSISAANKVGSTLTLNTTTHVATFTNLNWTINAGQSDTLVIAGTIAGSGIVGNIMMLGLRDASAITLSSTSTGPVTGTFPMFGSKVSPATIAVGTATVQMLTTPGATNLLSGSTDQPLATLKFASTGEDFKLLAAKFTQGGSAVPGDLSNLTLKYGSVVLATVPAISANNTLTFNISAPADENLVKMSQTRDFTIYTDIASGVNTTRTIRLDIQQAADVSAQGVTSGGLVAVTASGSVDCQAGITFPNQGCLQTVSQGSLTTAISPAYNPSAGNLVKGTSQRKATALRFSASNTEAVNVTQLTLTRAGTSADTDLSTISLAEVGAGGVVGAILATGSLSSNTVQFGTNTINAFDSTYLFQVPKGGNKDIYVLADIPTSSAGTNFRLSVASAAHVKADGVASQNDIPSGSVTGTATGNLMTITANGTVTVSASNTTVAATYVKGAKDKEFARFTFTADDGENVTVSSFKVTFKDAVNGTPLLTVNSPTNVRVYKDSVSAANLAGTVSTPSTGVANFSFSNVISAGTARAYIVVADIPSTTGATAMVAEVSDTSADVTITGNSSGANIGTLITTDPNGNLMTIATGNLGVIASRLPVYTNVTEKSSNVEVARFVLASGTNGETVRVSSLKITLAGVANSTVDNKSVENADISNITLYNVNGGNIDGSNATKVVGALTSGTATFSGLAIDIASGNQVVVGVKVTINDSQRTTPNIVMGIENYYTDVSASGMDSLTTIYANQLIGATTAALSAVSAIGDVDLTDNLTAELSTYGVPALGITAVGNGDVIQLESEKIIVTDAANSTVVRDGFAGTDAAEHAIAIPVQLVTGGASVLESGNNISAYADGDGAITFASTVAATFAAGQLMAVYDPDTPLQEDDIRLITAITTSGLTLTTKDIYAGAVVTEETAVANAIAVHLTNYGQAQLVQANGALTLAVASGTPAVGQVVAGATGVEFSRVKLTSLYEPIKLTMIKFTRTGGSDADFSSLYLQNLTSSTWGPNGNGKSNTTTLVGGVATFNFDDANAFVVDNNAVSGIEIAIKGNLNTVTTGVTSGDAPKFAIAALTTANLTAKGGSTGVALTSFTAGTPTPATAGNFNSQVVYKGKLSLALNSGSLSGTQTRGPSQTILKLDATSASTGSTATFRAAALNSADTATTAFTGALTSATTWAVIDPGSDGSTITNDGTNYIDGAASQKFTQGTTTPAVGGGLSATFAATDLSGYTGVSFWIRAQMTGATTYTVSLTGGTGTSAVSNTTAANGTWVFIDIPFSGTFSGLTAVTAFQIVNASVAPTFADYFDIDRLMFYNDKIKLNMSSNTGLFVTTGVTNTAVTLTDGTTTLATGYYTGTTSAGSVTFIPTTQFTIPTTGKTLQVLANTSNLVTATSRTLAMTLGLGSADNAGTVTAGDVFWWDEAASSIQWIDSAPNPIQSSAISY